MLDIKFKDYTIGKPCYLGNKEPSPWEFTVCKKNKNDNTHFVIADFYYNFKEPCWEFKSVGTRYLEYYSEGLNEWLLKVMDLLKHQLLTEENTDDC